MIGILRKKKEKKKANPCVIMLAVKYWFLVLYLLPSLSALLSFPACLLWSSPHPSLLSSGGRGSYNDMGGPVITTQVTIPKDVSTRQQLHIKINPPYQHVIHNNQAVIATCDHVICTLSSKIWHFVMGAYHIIYPSIPVGSHVVQGCGSPLVLKVELLLFLYFHIVLEYLTLYSWTRLLVMFFFSTSSA